MKNKICLNVGMLCFALSIHAQIVLPAGHTGIRTTDPLATLHVDGNGDTTISPIRQNVTNDHDDFFVDNNGNVSIGNFQPLNRFSILTRNSDLYNGISVINVKTADSSLPGIASIIELSTYSENSSQGWKIHSAGETGFQGVGSNNFEIWEYPGPKSTVNDLCCRQRLVVENTVAKNDITTRPATVVLKADGGVKADNFEGKNLNLAPTVSSLTPAVIHGLRNFDGNVDAKAGGLTEGMLYRDSNGNVKVVF